jgi:hypothetical protein
VTVLEGVTTRVPQLPMPESTEVAIKVTAEDPKKKKDEQKDGTDPAGSFKSKDNAEGGEGEELVRASSLHCMERLTPVPSVSLKRTFN